MKRVRVIAKYPVKKFSVESSKNLFSTISSLTVLIVFDECVEDLAINGFVLLSFLRVSNNHVEDVEFDDVFIIFFLSIGTPRPMLTNGPSHFAKIGVLKSAR